MKRNLYVFSTIVIVALVMSGCFFSKYRRGVDYTEFPDRDVPIYDDAIVFSFRGDDEDCEIKYGIEDDLDDLIEFYTEELEEKDFAVISQVIEDDEYACIAHSNKWNIEIEAEEADGEVEDYYDVVVKVTAEMKSIEAIAKNLPRSISAGELHTIGLKPDRTVATAGNNEYNQCDIENWTNIIAIRAGAEHTVGLKSDGTVVTVGNNEYGQCNTENWSDIIAVGTGGFHTIGIKSDGTIVATGYNNFGQCNIEDWTDIIDVCGGRYNTIGLKSDGTVVAVGEGLYGQCNTEDWNNIIAFSAGKLHTIGLKSDGTVLALGLNDDGQCDVEDWIDIIAVSGGEWYTIGLKSDGTVVAVGRFYKPDIESWTDIISISAGWNHAVGLKSDGSVMVAGVNRDGRCDVEEWNDISTVDARAEDISSLVFDESKEDEQIEQRTQKEQNNSEETVEEVEAEDLLSQMQGLWQLCGFDGEIVERVYNQGEFKEVDCDTMHTYKEFSYYHTQPLQIVDENTFYVYSESARPDIHVRFMIINGKEYMIWDDDLIFEKTSHENVELN